MLDFGFAELMVIIALVVLVVGPNELPTIMRTLGRLVRRLQYVRYAITQQFDDMMREGEMEDIAGQVNFEARAEKGSTFDEASADEEYMEDYAMMPQSHEGSEETASEISQSDKKDEGAV